MDHKTEMTETTLAPPAYSNVQQVSPQIAVVIQPQVDKKPPDYILNLDRHQRVPLLVWDILDPSIDQWISCELIACLYSAVASSQANQDWLFVGMHINYCGIKQNNYRGFQVG